MRPLKQARVAGSSVPIAELLRFCPDALRIQKKKNALTI
jgi:hypothetical protein